MIESELENAVLDAKNGLDNIVKSTEKFVDENILNGGSLSFDCGWNDACGKKISDKLITSVNNGISKWLNIYDCKLKLEKILDDILPLIGIIEDAQEVLK